MTQARHSFAFRPDLRLAVTGGGSTLRHFDAEYGPASGVSSGPCAVEVDFGSNPEPSVTSVAGGHKTVRWEVGLGSPDAEELRAHVRLRGRPRSFALSLVQGYFVEPLVALAAVRRDYVLLPAAALQQADTALLLVGRSRSGKSSVCARALAAGRVVLGDDHVLLGSSTCYPFPRRMRFYPDLRQTAADAYRSLPASVRAGLIGRATVRTLSRGYVAPPVRVAAANVGHAPPPAPLPLGRVVVVERDPTVRELVVESFPSGASEAAAYALAALAEQRTKLRAPGSVWAQALDAASKREEALLSETFAGVPCERIAIPDDWPSTRAIPALARQLGVDP